MDKVLVIGGSGFVGSHTADKLSEEGFDVTIFDSISSKWLREDQKMVIGNMLDQELLTKTLKGFRYVYHFGGIADIQESKEKPYDTISLNVMGTTVALEAAIKNNVEKFIYASTMYVYSPYGSFYRASKQAAETIIETYCNENSLRYCLLRYGSLYGPRAQSWNGLKKSVNQIFSEGKLDYFGSGKERREYIHVRDAARLSVNILDESHDNQAINLTGQQVLVSDELINMIFEIAGKEKNVKYIDRDFNPDHYLMTPYRYTPKSAKKIVPESFIDLGEGILEVIQEIDNNLNNEEN